MNNEVFTASNGLQIRHLGYEGLEYRDSFGWELVRGHGPGSDLGLALTEYFRHKEDERLGRWRSKADPSYVAYTKLTGHFVRFVNEATGVQAFYSRGHDAQYSSDPFSAIAEEYYNAHPEKKPWHDAKPGEVWVLESTSQPDLSNPLAFTVEDKGSYRKFVPVEQGTNILYVNVDGSAVTDGRRIWPESKETTND